MGAAKRGQIGDHGIGVADLMKEAGLTHGGFYAHFDSREALVIEAFGYNVGDTVPTTSNATTKRTSTERDTNIAAAGGNVTQAAQRLQLHPNYLHRLMSNMELR